MKPSSLLLAVGSLETTIDMENQQSKRLAQCEEKIIWMSHDQSYNQACYATLVVWCIMKYCPNVVRDSFKSQVSLPKLHRAFEVVQRRASRDKEPTPKNEVL